jgi:hypothetical protein
MAEVADDGVADVFMGNKRSSDIFAALLMNVGCRSLLAGDGMPATNRLQAGSYIIVLTGPKFLVGPCDRARLFVAGVYFAELPQSLIDKRRGSCSQFFTRYPHGKPAWGNSPKFADQGVRES